MHNITQILKSHLRELPFVRKFLDYFNLSHMYQEDTNISIPKDVHFIWLGSGLSDKHKQNILSWIKHNQDYTVHLWIDSATIWLETVKYDVGNIRSFCAANGVLLHDIVSMPDFASFVVQPWYNDWVNGEHKVYAFAADHLRLIILYKYGGIYSDIDVKCKRAIGALLSDYGFVGLTDIKYPNKTIIKDNWFIAAVSGCHILIDCLATVKINYDKYMLNGTTLLHRESSCTPKAIISGSDDDYLKGRFVNSSTNGFKCSKVGTMAVLYQLRKIIAEKANNPLFTRDFFIADDVLEHQNDHSWGVAANLQTPPGIRGLSIEGFDVPITSKSSVSLDVLIKEKANSQRLEPVVITTKLNSPRLDGVRYCT